MFITYADYAQAALELLQDKPKGTGYSNGTGVVLLISGCLHYVEDGEGIEDACEGDLSVWDEASSLNEYQSMRSPVLIQRFTPEVVVAYEQNNGTSVKGVLVAESADL